mmetsp:Transcript_27191/g.90977  ORF Transcript_27191/g.90977 Transcript_27191/m.90977 type:complete len:494 (+) Transcript_27191:1230-2711(+)
MAGRDNVIGPRHQPQGMHPIPRALGGPGPAGLRARPLSSAAVCRGDRRHRVRAVAVHLQLDLVVLHQGRPVRDGEHGDVAGHHGLHAARLSVEVERARGLVQDGEPRPVVERAGKGHALHLASGEHLVPGLEGVQAKVAEQVLEPHGPEALLDGVVVGQALGGGHRVGHLGAQVAHAHVGLLGQEEHAPGAHSEGLEDLPGGGLPDAREAAQEARLAAARVADDDHRRPLPHRDAHTLREHAAVGRLVGQISAPEGHGVRRGGHRRGRRVFDAHEGLVHLHDALAHARDGGQLREEPRERLDGAGQHVEGAQDGAQLLDGVHVPGPGPDGHRGDEEAHEAPAHVGEGERDDEPEVLERESPLVAHHAGEAAREHLPLALLAAVEGDGLGEGPDAQVRAPEVPLPVLLLRRGGRDGQADGHVDQDGDEVVGIGDCGHAPARAGDGRDGGGQGEGQVAQEGLHEGRVGRRDPAAGELGEVGQVRGDPLVWVVHSG